MPRKKKPQQNVRLDAVLEGLVLRAMILGELSPDVVEPEELGPVGVKIQAAVKGLPPRPGQDALVAALVGSGVGEGEARREILDLLAMDGTAPAAEELLQRVRDKHLANQLLVDLSNQLASGKVELLDLFDRLQEAATEGAVRRLEPLSVQYGEGEWPDPPVGEPLRSFPKLTDDSGGLMGVWIVAGPAGCGKSTFAWQVAIESELPVIYYDFENSLPVLLGRTKEAYGRHGLGAVRNRLGCFYYRDSVVALARDLAQVPPPALVVFDSLQKLPGNLVERRADLDRWLKRMEEIKRMGYTVLTVSEINRASYRSEIPGQDIFKDTGEAEYTADFGFQLKPEPDSPAFVKVFAVKNRHRPVLGYLGSWSRLEAWRFKENAGAPAASPAVPPSAAGVTGGGNPLVSSGSSVAPPQLSTNPLANWGR